MKGSAGSRQETVFNVKKAFYGCLLARQFRDVAEEAVTLAEKHLKNVRNMYDVGMASKFDLLRTEVQLANLQPQLIKARNALALAEIGLKTLLGLDLGREVEIQGELGYKDVEANLDASVVQAMSLRPEIVQFNLQKQMAAEMLKSAKAAYLPTVGIGGAVQPLGRQVPFRRRHLGELLLRSTSSCPFRSRTGS